MMKLNSKVTTLVGVALLSVYSMHCGENHVLLGDPHSGPDSTASSQGSLRLALEVGAAEVDTVTAVISGDNGFVTQTHQIDVSGDNGVISIFFGTLPTGDYRITLTAGDCGGSGDFEIAAGEVAFVNVPLSCGGGSSATGSVQVTGTITSGSSADCDHVLKIVAAPSIQDGVGPASSVELFLQPGVTATTIAWTTTSSDGRIGTLEDVSGVVDLAVTFECNSNGRAAVVASVTALSDSNTSCTQQARANVECVNQGGSVPRCGDNVINQPSEQCDGTAALPAGTPAGSTCSSACAIVPPAAGPRCGDNVINQPSEQCDGTAALPAGTPAGSTCSSACAIVPPAATQGACLSCAQANCPTQYANSVAATDAATLADVTLLFDCVLGSDWQLGNAIPQTSCFFADPVQPLGSLVPCYCGSTPQATCLATGPANNQEACGMEVERASRCNPVSASCVTSSGSNPAVPLGAALQLLNCERAACTEACGFPPPVEE